MSGVWPIVWERLVASWRLLLVLAIGILVAATLLAASPTYTRVMSDLGLESSLKERLRSSTRSSLIRFGLALGTPEASEEIDALGRAMAEEISWFTGSEARFASAADLTYAREGQPLPTGRLRTVVSLQSMSGLSDHVLVVEGRLPTPTSDPGRLEVALPAEAAAFLGLKPGDRFIAGHAFDDCNRPPPTEDPNEARERARFPCLPSAFVTLQAQLTVSGVIEQKDAEDPYWSAGHVTFARPATTDEAGPLVPALLPEESFYRALPLIVPGIRSEFRLTGFTDIERLDSSNLAKARESLARLRARTEARHAIADLPMASALGDFHSRASFSQVPLLILLLQVVGIALYYVLLVSSMLVDRRAEEIAMLRSRGASVGQVVAMSAIEAGVVGLAATIVAPFLAAGAVAALGKTGTFEDISGGDFLPFTVVPASFALAAAGAALAVLAVVIPTFFAARRGMILFLRGAARPGKPLLQRYYIDVAVAALAGLALWELRQRGSVYDPKSVGGWSADPLLLVSPLLLMLAVGALLFRFFPPLLAFISRFAAVTAGPGVVLGLWHLTRSPARYTQLALLLVMAAAVGTFAATYGKTTEQSQIDRARFEVGVDARTAGLGDLARPSETGEGIRDRLLSLPGVEEAATAFRGSLTLGPLPVFGSTIPVLGIDPEVAPSLLWFRDDFASEDLTSLLRRIIGSPTGGSGLVLPGDPVAVTVWAGPSQPRESSTLWLRALDSEGTFSLHELGTLDYAGYRRLTATIRPEDVVYPISIVGLLITQPTTLPDTSRGSLFVDDIGVIDAFGAEQVVEDFEGPFRWEILRTATRDRNELGQVSQGARRGNGAAQLSFRTGSSAPLQGMLPSDPNLPAPALASERFLRRTGAQVGSEIDLVVGSVLLPVTIRGTTGLFPTMPDSNEGFIVLNQRHISFFAGVTNQSVGREPTEAWLKLSDDPAVRADAIAALGARYRIAPSSVVDVQQVIEKTRTDPVLRASGSGVLLLALVAALAVLALGFALTLYTGGQARTVEMSVMRAVGVSRAEVVLMVALEYLLVAAIGLGVGTAAGLRISSTMLSFLNLTPEGGRLVPPFALATEWGMIGLAFGFMALAFVVGIAALALYFLRLPVSRILRLTR